MISSISNVNFNGKMPKANKILPKTVGNMESSGEYIRGYRGIMDNFLTPEKLEKERFNATVSGNFSFIQGVKDALAKLAEVKTKNK